MTRWLLLSAAIIAEVIGSLSLKAGLDRPGWYALVAVGYVGAFLLLSLTLRQGVPLGVAYGVWGAGGVALTAVMSAVIFGEPLTVLMSFGIVVVIGGVLLVELGAHTAPAHSATRAGGEE